MKSYLVNRGKEKNHKITGEIRYHYADHDADGVDGDGNENKLRSRIWVNGQVNEDWSYTGMFENNQDFDNDEGDETVKLQRAYVNGKLGGVKVQAGRYNLKLADGNVYDTRFDGVQASYGKDVKLTAGYGKATPSTVKRPSAAFAGIYEDLQIGIEKESDEAYYVDLSGKLGKLGLNAGYYAFDNVAGDLVNVPADTVAVLGEEDLDIWMVGANYAFDKNVKLGAMYLKGSDEYLNYYGDDFDDDGYVVTATYKGAKASQPGSWGLVAKYYDQGMTTYFDHTINGLADSMMGFKGYSVMANYTFAKNIVGQVEWYDLEEKEGDRDSETLWAQLLFTF